MVSECDDWRLCLTLVPFTQTPATTTCRRPDIARHPTCASTTRRRCRSVISTRRHQPTLSTAMPTYVPPELAPPVLRRLQPWFTPQPPAAAEGEAANSSCFILADDALNFISPVVGTLCTPESKPLDCRSCRLWRLHTTNGERPVTKKVCTLLPRSTKLHRHSGVNTPISTTTIFIC